MAISCEGGIERQLLQAAACPDGYARKRRVDKRDGETRLLPKELVDSAQERAAADDHKPSLHDVGCELSRCAFKRRLYRQNDPFDRPGEGLPNFRSAQERAP